MVDGCLEDLDYLRKHWKARVKKSHRKADKYNQKKKRKAVEDRTATNRKLSEQQQARCERWAAGTRRACICNLETESVLDGREIVWCAVNILERF